MIRMSILHTHSEYVYLFVCTEEYINGQQVLGKGASGH